MYQLPPLPAKKKPRPAYRKPEAVKGLERLATDETIRKHPAVDEKYLAPWQFRDDTANGLTRCIVKYISICGGFASRVNNQGTYDAKRKRYRPSTARRGLPDILATWKGQSLFIEVKVGRDRMSEHQMKVQQEQEQSGGLYFVAHNFTAFKQWFDRL